MADLLGSILKSMDKPPSAKRSDQRAAAAKKQEESIKKMVEEEKKQLREFKVKVDQRMAEFIADESKPSLKFEPMESVHRTIVHDVSDAKGLFSMVVASKEKDAEPHVVVFKQDSVPSEEELTALKRGEVYDPVKIALQKVLEAKEELEAMKKKKIVPVTNYREKYEHLIGKEIGKKAATIAKPSEQFGLVPTALKRDQRSVEETLNDIRSKKKLKQDLNLSLESNLQPSPGIVLSSRSTSEAGKDDSDNADSGS